MLHIHERRLYGLTFQAETETYSGTVTIGYSFADDPDHTHRANIAASAAKPRQARYSWIEQAILDAASQSLINHFARVLQSVPDNIFAADKPFPPPARAA